MKTAIYAGSFDPMTKGHLDILRQALLVFDRIKVGIGVNPNKKRLFDQTETIQMIDKSLQLHFGADASRVSIQTFSGALIHFAEQERADAMIKGLRQVSDFNDEFVQHGINSRASPIPIVYFICTTEFLHVSSSSAKEMTRYGIDTDWLVDPHVGEALKSTLGVT